MTPERWIDHGTLPPFALPDDPDAGLVYLSEVLGHVCFERWTLTRLKSVFPALASAKTAKPAVFALLLEHTDVIEWWEAGRVRTAPAELAPLPQVVLQRLLRTHRRRFKRQAVVPTRPSTARESDDWLVATALAGVAPSWLQRRGRYGNPLPDTNTLGVDTDFQALELFLRDRASRSRHTLRAYIAEIGKLVEWCRDRNLGPLSDLTRADLLAYREWLMNETATSNASSAQRVRSISDSARSRSLAVLASLYQYWSSTGYLVANPGIGLSAAARRHAGFVPQRFLPPDILAVCDALVDAPDDDAGQALERLRRHAIWALYRYAGVRLAELVWSVESGLPRVEAESPEGWTLLVRGKGNKDRAIPLPSQCVKVLRKYRQARGLPDTPSAHEALALIHGMKGGSLRESGLYREVKTVFDTAAQQLEAAGDVRATIVQAFSPHWLRHAYARTLVVAHQVPLPAAQALLGHASVQTTAAYAKTDLSQLRDFIDSSFGKE